jgi:hypothetical protein
MGGAREADPLMDSIEAASAPMNRMPRGGREVDINLS